jgi:glucose/arabinose dehydrogenase
VRRGLGVVLLAGLLAACGGSAGTGDAASVAPVGADGPRAVRIVSGLGRLTSATAAPSEPGRLYVVQKVGRVLLVQGRRVRSQPFLDLSDLVGSDANEQGLLSMVFHPDYPSRPRVYVNFTDRRGDTRVLELRVRGGRAVRAGARELLSVDQPYQNHNGGQLAFGPDGLLYVGMGDGGAGGDPENRAQSLSSRLGKLLRLDVDRPGADWQMVAYGLRNPWRFSFDRLTGDLWIGDVGQNAYEEIDYLPRRAGLPVNFGWDVLEGTHGFEDKPFTEGGRVVGPIFEYSHDNGCSVTGGYVYRGSRLPSIRGRYFFGDYCSGIVWSMVVRNGRRAGLRREAFRVSTLTSFAEDARGELYLISDDGSVYRLAR